MLFYPVWEIENWKNDDSKKKHIKNVKKITKFIDKIKENSWIRAYGAVNAKDQHSVYFSSYWT